MPKSILKTDTRSKHTSRKDNRSTGRGMTPRKNSPIKHMSPEGIQKKYAPANQFFPAKQRENLAAFKFKPHEGSTYRPTSDFRASSLESKSESKIGDKQSVHSEKSVSPALTQDTLRQHNVDYDSSAKEDDGIESTTISIIEDKVHNSGISSPEIHNSVKIRRQSTVTKEIPPKTPLAGSNDDQPVNRVSTGHKSRQRLHTAGTRSVKMYPTSTQIEDSRQSLGADTNSSAHRQASVDTWADEPIEPRGPSRNGKNDIDVETLDSLSECIDKIPHDTAVSKTRLQTEHSVPNIKNKESLESVTPNQTFVSFQKDKFDLQEEKCQENKIFTPNSHKELAVIPKNHILINSKSDKENIKQPKHIQPVRNVKEADTAMKPQNTKDIVKSNLQPSKSHRTVKKQPETTPRDVKKEQHKNKIVFKVKASNQAHNPNVYSEKPSIETSRQSSVLKSDNKSKKVVSIKSKANTSGAKNVKSKPRLELRVTKTPSPDYGSRIELESLSDGSSVDIFELARQRYGIMLDSDGESVL